MPLIQNDGELWVSLLLAGRYKGLDCYLCCPGPSLKDVDPSLLSDRGRLVIAVNTAYPRVPKPDLWIGLDRVECYDRALLREPFPKIMGSKFINDETPYGLLKDQPAVWFATGRPGNPEDLFDRTRFDTDFLWNDNGGNCAWPGGTFLMALHIAVWLGCKRIHLIGCDFGGAADYHDDRVLRDDQRDRNRKLYAALADMTVAVAARGRTRGVEIVSCTPDSPINGPVPYVPLLEAVAASTERAAVAQGPVLDGRDADLLRWTQAEPFAQCGILTACDAAFEWLLPWWYENLRKHNLGVPLAFCDYGLSPQMRAWCEERGVVYHADGPAQMWFRKVFAMLNTPFRRTLFVEPDCEIQADLRPLFAGHELVVTDDPYNPWSKAFRTLPLATGVIAFDRNDWLILKWATALVSQPTKWRSDQEAFNSIVAELEADRAAAMDTMSEVRIVDRSWQWLRLDDRSGDAAAKIIHWTGPEGKEIIRRKMLERGNHGGNGSPAVSDPAGPVGDADKAPLVSVIVPACGRESLFEQHVKALASLPWAGHIEYCIATWGDPAPLLDILNREGRFGAVKHTRVSEEGCYTPETRACNAALGMATGSVVWYVGADVCVPPHLVFPIIKQNTVLILPVKDEKERWHIGPDRQVAAPFSWAAWRQDIRVRWDEEFAHGTGYGDNDFVTRLLLDGIEFEWPDLPASIHLFHPPYSPASNEVRATAFEANHERFAAKLPMPIGTGIGLVWWESMPPHGPIRYSPADQAGIRASLHGYGARHPDLTETNTDPLVSILMPARNAAKYIGQAIESCKAQTYRNWELVVVVNGPVDGTFQTATEAAGGDKRILVGLGPNDGGYAKSFNMALAEANGEIIMRLDADDYMHPRRIAEQVAAFREHPEAAICTCGAFNDIGGVIEVRQSVPLDPERYVNGEEPLYPPNTPGIVRRDCCWPAMPTVTARATAYAAVGPFPEDFDQAADAAWNFKAIEAGLKWIHVEEPLYYYRRHAGQMTAQGGGSEQTANYLKLVEAHRERARSEYAVA
ncbi:MAG: glycosyltransferase [Planctomycetota bacterium]